MTDTPKSDASSAAQKSTWLSFLKSIASFSGDLSTLTAPSFILSGTSLLEYSAYWAEHPDLLCSIPEEVSPEQRMVAVVKWYLATLKGQFSARHESVGGEKKPLNPILGEEFHGRWDTPKHGRTTLTAEQVSHHPPISAYAIRTANGVVLEGHNGQKSGFSGRTITVKQVGFQVLQVPLSDGSIERYFITLPQITLEGLFFGSPYAELTDKSFIASTSGWVAEHEYSGKGWLSGKKNSVKTRIWSPQSYDAKSHERPKWIVEGVWTEEMRIRPGLASSSSDDGQTFLDMQQLPPQHIDVQPADDEAYDSRKLWSGVADALKKQDFDRASKLKSAIEQGQRDLRKKEKREGAKWARKYFIWQASEAVPAVVKELASRVHRPCDGMWHYNGVGDRDQAASTSAAAASATNDADSSDGDEAAYDTA